MFVIELNLDLNLFLSIGGIFLSLMSIMVGIMSVLLWATQQYFRVNDFIYDKIYRKANEIVSNFEFLPRSEIIDEMYFRKSIYELLQFIRNNREEINASVVYNLYLESLYSTFQSMLLLITCRHIRHFICKLSGGHSPLEVWARIDVNALSNNNIEHTEIIEYEISYKENVEFQNFAKNFYEIKNKLNDLLIGDKGFQHRDLLSLISRNLELAIKKLKK